MIIRKIYVVSETNKYENQIALVKEKRIIRESEDKHTYRVTLSVTGNAVSAFDVGKEEYSNFVSGDIVTYVVDEKDSKKILSSHLLNQTGFFSIIIFGSALTILIIVLFHPDNVTNRPADQMKQLA